MPFKLHLKKSRHYNVISKSLFVICVELLDGTTIECSLSAESLGSECMEYVCQRLALQQYEFFGLCYTSRHGISKWVEMDRPLKRQLDKYGRDQSLYLRVMYYVNNVSLIQDETTRYHYFLQVKKDVIEGRVQCSVEEAILLATFAMQAEFGNHDHERHTAEYLKDFVVFPQHIMEHTHHMDLYEAVVQQHAGLAGLPQGSAEERYILMVKQLEGYGQETFLAKGSNRNSAIVGVSLTGIIVGQENNTNTKFYQWKDISNVINHKKQFIIECQSPEDNAQFEFADPELAKYVWKLCVLQHTFYMQNDQNSDGPINKPQIERVKQNTEEQLQFNNLFKQTGETRTMDSLDDLDRKEPLWRSTSLTAGVGQRAQSTSYLDLTSQPDADRLRALLPSYRPAPDYETAIQHKYIRQAANVSRSNHQVGILYSSQPEIHQTHIHENVGGYHYPDVTQVERLYVDDTQHRMVKANHRAPGINIHTYSTPDLDNLESRLLAGFQFLQLYKAPPPYRDALARPNSNSTPDLASQTFGPLRTTFNKPQVSGSSPDLVSTRTLSTKNISHLYLDTLHTNSEAHRTYTNLTDIGQGIVYHKERLSPNPVAPVAPFRTSKPSAEKTEPIYENIPLPWTEGNTEIRSRTPSTQSAPEIISNKEQANGKTPNNETQTEMTENKLNSSVGNLSQGNHSITSQLNSTVKTNASDMNKTSISLHSTEKSTTSTETDTSSKSKSWKRWGILGKGKSSTLQKNRDKNDNCASREQPYRWSTGLRWLPIAPTASKESLCQCLERKLADPHIFYEFEKIPKMKRNPDFTTALHPDNASRNRYKDVLPYEENRVRLTPTKDNKMGYVNASHITATVGNSQRFYVAAQGPMSQTVDTFWQAVWEADVYLVVRLTSKEEEDCFAYLPESSDHCLQLGDYQIWKEFSQETGHCLTSRLRVTHTTGRRSRSIWHLQYTEWGEQGCPSSPSHFLGFLEELNSVRLHTIEDIPAGHNRNPPVLVHCNAGVGRTGVTILCDLVLYTLDNNQEVDVPRVVALLRHQRMLMIQTVAQYHFTFNLLLTYLKQSRLI
ncbi:hypothetical protein RUM43_013789 [Polyplax serrata]|uniref:protein-tyrosine-phosphatase n=1 Tax=Polyplax serrata TaxID=468196 RepID=A0AAN8P4N4_POLSC